MVMSWIWTTLLTVSLVFAWFTDSSAALAGAVLQGAQAGVTLAISMAGAICLWTGVGNLMAHTGVTDSLSRLMRPALNRLFPSTGADKALALSIFRRWHKWKFTVTIRKS